MKLSSLIILAPAALLSEAPCCILADQGLRFQATNRAEAKARAVGLKEAKKQKFARLGGEELDELVMRMLSGDSMSMPDPSSPTPTDPPTDPPSDVPSSRSGNCFSAFNTVEVLGTGKVQMSDLKVGDKVRVSAQEYEPVYSFGHYQVGQEQEYLQVHFRIATGSISRKKTREIPLEVTKDHLLYIQKGRNGKTKTEAVRTDEIRPGATLLSTGVNQPAYVTKISKITRTGSYLPLTRSGRIVVGSVVTSNSVALNSYLPESIHEQLMYYLPFLNDDNLFYYWLSPYRMLCMGVSKTIGENYQLHSNKEDGILNWLLWGEHLAKVADDLPFFVQFSFIGLPLLFFFVCLNVMEWMFGPALAPTMMLALLLCSGAFLQLVKVPRRTKKDKKA